MLKLVHYVACPLLPKVGYLLSVYVLTLAISKYIFVVWMHNHYLVCLEGGNVVESEEYQELKECVPLVDILVEMEIHNESLVLLCCALLCEREIGLTFSHN
jgi:hypothetical protein